MREVNGGNGDHSQVPFRQHFGLAQAKAVDRLQIRWPNGYIEKLDAAALRRRELVSPSERIWYRSCGTANAW